MDKYPVPANAFYDPLFIPLTTSSSQPLRVDEYNRLYVHPDDNGNNLGTCTASTTSGYVTVVSTSYSELDRIYLATNSVMSIKGIHSFCTTQVQTEIVAVNSSTEFILVGGSTESTPVWDFNCPVPIEYTALEETDIILRVKGLRQGRVGQGTGRLFAKII